MGLPRGGRAPHTAGWDGSEHRVFRLAANCPYDTGRGTGAGAVGAGGCVSQRCSGFPWHTPPCPVSHCSRLPLQGLLPASARARRVLPPLLGQAWGSPERRNPSPHLTPFWLLTETLSWVHTRVQHSDCKQKAGSWFGYGHSRKW